MNSAAKASTCAGLTSFHVGPWAARTIWLRFVERSAAMATVKMPSISAGSANAEMVISRPLPMPPKALAGSKPPKARKNRPKASRPTNASAPPKRLKGADALTSGTISPASSVETKSTWGMARKIQEACSEMTMSLRRNFSRSRYGCQTRGPRVWQPYLDLHKFLRKDMVISEHASWIFRAMPQVLFVSTLLAGLMVPLVSASAPLSLFGGALAFVGLLALGRFFLALGGLDTASAFGGMGSSREMTISALAEPALMLGIFTVAIAADRSTNLSQMVLAAQGPTWKLLNPAHVLAFAALFIVLLAETGRIPVDNPATHLELTMIHEVMVLDHSGPDFAFIQYGAALKLWVFGALLVGIVLPVRDAHWSANLAALLAGMIVLAVAIGTVESCMARLRLLRVPKLLVGATALAVLALVLVLA